MHAAGDGEQSHLPDAHCCPGASGESVMQGWSNSSQSWRGPASAQSSKSRNCFGKVVLPCHSSHIRSSGSGRTLLRHCDPCHGSQHYKKDGKKPCMTEDARFDLGSRLSSCMALVELCAPDLVRPLQSLLGMECHALKLSNAPLASLKVGIRVCLPFCRCLQLLLKTDDVRVQVNGHSLLLLCLPCL